MGRPLTRFLLDDHRRLDALLRSVVADPLKVDQPEYNQCRAGLLRHIGMEEKILLPAAQRLSGGQSLAIAAKLRRDHAALASLLMPTPTASIIATIRAILAAHNALEEGPGGLYEICDDLVGQEADQLVTSLCAAPEVAVMPHSDSPTVVNALQRALERAGYNLIEDQTAGEKLKVLPNEKEVST
mgnify:FL=1